MITPNTKYKKEKKKIPDLRFPGFEGEFFELKIGKSIDQLVGFSFKGEDIVEDHSGIPLLRGVNITEGRIRHNKEIDRFYIGATSNLTKFFLKDGDLVIGMDGSKVGKNSALITKEDEGSLLIQRVARIRVKETVSILFIFHHINSMRFHNYVEKVKTSSAIPHISSKQINDFKIFFPTYPEQQKIASFLSVVDQKIQHLIRKKELLELYKKGVTQKIFPPVGGQAPEIRFRDENGNDFPDWEEKRLGDVAFINPKSKALPETFIYIDLESVEKGMLLKEEEIKLKYAPSRAQRLLNNGDILFQTVRPYQKNNYFFEKKGDYVASTGYAQMRAKKNPLFLYQLLHYQPLVNLIVRWSTGSNYPAISPSDLRNISILVPSVSEQEKIGSFLQEIDLKIDSTITEINQTKKFKKGLLQQMFV